LFLDPFRTKLGGSKKKEKMKLLPLPMEKVGSNPRVLGVEKRKGGEPISQRKKKILAHSNNVGRAERGRTYQKREWEKKKKKGEGRVSSKCSRDFPPGESGGGRRVLAPKEKKNRTLGRTCAPKVKLPKKKGGKKAFPQKKKTVHSARKKPGNKKGGPWFIR